MKRAIRWVPARSEYRDWRVPDGASYTSRLIHNDLGFGYAVCPRCYEAEFREMGESCDL